MQEKSIESQTVKMYLRFDKEPHDCVPSTITTHMVHMNGACVPHM